MGFDFGSLLSEVGGFIEKSPDLIERLKNSKYSRKQKTVDMDTSKEHLLQSQLKTQQLQQEIKEKDISRGIMPRVIDEINRTGKISPETLKLLSPEAISQITKSASTVAGIESGIEKEELVQQQLKTQTQRMTQQGDLAEKRFELDTKRLELDAQRIAAMAQKTSTKDSKTLEKEIRNRIFTVSEKRQQTVGKHKITQEFESFIPQYNTVKEVYEVFKKDPSKQQALQDVVGIIYNKGLDPDSIVKEGELKRVFNEIGMYNKVKGIMEQVTNFKRTGRAVPVEILTQYMDVIDMIAKYKTELYSNLIESSKATDLDIFSKQYGPEAATETIHSIYDFYENKIPDNFKGFDTKQKVTKSGIKYEVIED